KRALRQDLLERSLALEQRLAAQILIVEIKQIEHTIEKPRKLPLGGLQQLKARSPVFVERHELAVEHGLVLDLSECRADRRIFARYIVEVAGIKRCLSGLRHGDGAEAVPFRLEHPIRIVERLVGQS